ncbi:Hypothetical protein A7982_11646 [Minicystis rosea]|nr:Hypothetical protein A7982_11646 [Minicystis rosea]
MNAEARFQALVASEVEVPLDALHALFDSLPAIEPSFMLGAWEGGVFRTGHKGERQLATIGWIGKTFHDENDVDPIISRGADGGREVNPILGKATLRFVRYRGVSTATMVYDQHPIFDHFRKISDDLVLGVMDRKGDAFPLYFHLRRLAGQAAQ